MALPSGVTPKDCASEDSLPTVPPGHGGARIAPDGSRWCATCQTTVRPGSKVVYCQACTRGRNTDGVRATRERARTAAKPVRLSFSSDAVESLLRSNSLLQRRMAVASGLNQPGDRQPAWLDELLLATKGMAVAVEEIEQQWREQASARGRAT